MRPTAGALRSLRYVAYSDMTNPGVQKPHCEPWASTSACCTGCSSPSSPRRCSTVVTLRPSSIGSRRMQALTAR